LDFPLSQIVPYRLYFSEFDLTFSHTNNFSKILANFFSEIRGILFFQKIIMFLMYFFLFSRIWENFLWHCQ